MQKYSTSYRNATFGCYKGKHSEEGNWCQYCCQWEWEASFASVYSYLRTSPQPIRGKLLTGQRDLLTTKAMVSLFHKYYTVIHGTKPAKLIKITILKIRASSSKLHRNSTIMENVYSSFDACLWKTPKRMCNTTLRLNTTSLRRVAWCAECCCSPYTTMMWPTVIIIDKCSMRGDPLWNDRLVFCKMCKSSGVRTALLLVKGTNFRFHKRWSSIWLCESSAFDVGENDCTLCPVHDHFTATWSGEMSYYSTSSVFTCMPQY